MYACWYIPLPIIKVVARHCCEVNFEVANLTKELVLVDIPEQNHKIRVLKENTRSKHLDWYLPFSSTTNNDN